MTIHAAKGLEFPVVAVLGLGTPPRAAAARTHVLFGPDPHRPPELKAGSGFQTADYATLADIEAQLDEAERLRLLYVALTRARDRLVVSVHHDAGRGSRSLAAHLDRAAPDGVRAEPLPLPAPAYGVPQAPSLPALPSPADWQDRHQALRRSASRPVVVAATAVRTLQADPPERPARAQPSPLPEPPVSAAVRAGDAAGSATADVAEEADLDDAGGVRRGRAGTAIGRATHRVLQLVDLHADVGDEVLERLASAEAEAEGIAGLASEVAARAASALASGPLDFARRAERVWRELYVAAPVPGPDGNSIVLEGFIDLVIEQEGKLHVVDYKTDAVRNEAAVASSVAGYRLQGAAYALALNAVTGRRVRSCTFVFCGAEEAIVRRIADLNDAVAEVADILARRPRPLTAVQLDLFGAAGGTLFDGPNPGEWR
jgi:ATP-dependent helicase/nuclease subunit A